jgi:AcrR family transcriptional regulator
VVSAQPRNTTASRGGTTASRGGTTESRGGRLPAQERRRQLLDVAAEVFSERGFHATAMDDVAAAAGVTKPVLYQHFRNKRALFLELLDDVGAQLLAQLAAAAEPGLNGRARVEAGFNAYFRFVRDNPAAFRLLFGASVRNDPEFAERTERVLEDGARVVATLIDMPVDPVHRLVLAHGIVGIAEATSRRSIAIDDTTDHPDPERLAHWLAELAWFGLRGIRGDDPT